MDSLKHTLVSLHDFEKHANHLLARNAKDYYGSGANDMITLKENRLAYSRLQLVPRVLRDVSAVNMSVDIYGDRIIMPICVAPAAMQRMAHPDGESATARACAKHNVIMGLSSLSTTSLEDVAASAPTGLRWFQLYVYKDRAVTLDLVKRAERAGYKALAVTVDTPILGRREADIRNRFALPSHLHLGNFSNNTNKSQTASNKDGSGLVSYFSLLIDESLTWQEIAWLRTQTSLKIIVKGIVTYDAYTEAVEHGVDGIWISNHGARQLDTAPATLDALREIRRSVGGKFPSHSPPVFLDGGIMRGTDVLKAIALGAKAVFIGRPMLWGLAVGGQEGVEKVLQILRSELEMAMKLSGLTNIEEIDTKILRNCNSQLISKI